MTRRRRLDALEAAHWRRMVAQAAPPGITVDAILDECIRFLEIPVEQQWREYPNFTEDQRREMSPLLPAIRRARWGHRRCLGSGHKRPDDRTQSHG
jgi:hypothetical protein